MEQTLNLLNGCDHAGEISSIFLAEPISLETVGVVLHRISTEYLVHSTWQTRANAAKAINAICKRFIKHLRADLSGGFYFYLKYFFQLF